MKITLTTTPIGWQAADEDSIDGQYLEGRLVMSGDYGSGRTKIEALTELRDRFEERSEEGDARAAQGLAEANRLLAAEHRHDELAKFLLELARPLKPGWASKQRS